jgi:hypothetical protein
VYLDRAPIVPIVGPQVLTLAGSTWTCAVVRTEDFAGQRMVRVVGGTGGWRSTIPFKQYAGPALPIAIVLTDAALAALELTPSTVGFLGPQVLTGYWRQTGLASLVLQDILGDAWWMDPTGLVQSMPRPPTLVVSPFTAVAVDGAAGRYEIATDVPGEWLPGVTFVSPTANATVSRVMHTIDGSSLRTEVLSWP